MIPRLSAWGIRSASLVVDAHFGGLDPPVVAEFSRESSERMRRRQRDHAVAQGSEPVAAIGGQPMSHATNSGFKRRVDGEDSAPSVAVAGAWREQREFSAMFGSASPGECSPRWLCPFESRCFGVGHARACPSSSGSPIRSPLRFILPPVGVRGVCHIPACV